MRKPLLAGAVLLLIAVTIAASQKGGPYADGHGTLDPLLKKFETLPDDVKARHRACPGMAERALELFADRIVKLEEMQAEQRKRRTPENAARIKQLSKEAAALFARANDMTHVAACCFQSAFNDAARRPPGGFPAIADVVDRLTAALNECWRAELGAGYVPVSLGEGTSAARYDPISRKILVDRDALAYECGKADLNSCVAVWIGHEMAHYIQNLTNSVPGDRLAKELEADAAAGFGLRCLRSKRLIVGADGCAMDAFADSTFDDGDAGGDPHGTFKQIQDQLAKGLNGSWKIPDGWRLPR